MVDTYPYRIFDERRILAFPGDSEKTLNFSRDHWIEVAMQSIADHGFFAVALSGGSTPKKIYQKISSSDAANNIDWSKVYLFWSDERSVEPGHSDSNYRMAMVEGGFNQLNIPPSHIFRMVAETDIEENAIAYEQILSEKLAGHPFDLIMLGMGEDGHTASLFPYTAALHAKERLVCGNFVPQKNAWRMTFTYACINRARHICIYVVGAPKADILEKVFTSPPNFEEYPIQLVGSIEHPALWIIDDDAGKKLQTHLK